MEKVKYDLAVIIPGRNEEFQNITVQNVCDNIRGNTQVIAVIDGEWPKQPIIDRPNLTVLRLGEAQGQRRGTNLGAKLADSKYIMKLDAHCKVSKGFDLSLIQAFEKLGDDIVQIPTMYNLHAFDWKCKKCGNQWYQSPTPTHCMENGESRKENETCNSKEFERIMIWKKRTHRKSECYRFDTTLHFQYHRALMKKQEGVYIETMSAQGSCFVVSTENYFKWDICDEEWGSWGNQGTEVACKAWLSGNKLITNRNCWYSHMFRTQGGDFGFPYKQNNRQVENARKKSRDLFLNNKWEHQERPLSWLLERFRPLPSWHESKGKKVLDHVMKMGREFNGETKKGVIYYTDNQLRVKIAKKCQRQLSKATKGIQIVSSSLKPMNFGDNVVIKDKRGWITLNKQIIKALENLDSEIVYFTEHDVLYHQSHFNLVPEKKDTYYYNVNVWKVRSMDGHAVKVDNCKQLSGLICYKELALNHFKKRLKMIESYSGDEFNKYIRRIGFEPGTHNREERVDDFKAESLQSKHPNVDIRHGNNATATRWSPDQFRNKKYTKGWTESNNIEGWGQFKDFFGLVK